MKQFKRETFNNGEEVADGSTDVNDIGLWMQNICLFHLNK